MGMKRLLQLLNPSCGLAKFLLLTSNHALMMLLHSRKVSFYKFQHNHLKHFYCKIPITGITLLCSQKLRYVFLEQIAIQTQSISQRLAQRLLFILEGYGNRSCIEDFNIQISQDQLANMLTISRQTVNQELNLFEKQGIIQLGFKKIEVIDIEKLKKVAAVGYLKQ